MEGSSRYEIVDTIATGDFATVYRGRDRELGREVAIKQIHQQFLHDEQQLARYWQEAQLLASLQHPNVLTVYDIVRSRGWLILELMRGNLKQWTHGQPMDLDSLRNALAACLGGLQFLHLNGVIHGDIKPGNMLVDARNRVVLGDFGLARRASNEEGSLLKGTTKYMAPELVSEGFGAVGPASDLYSLGFSAYELTCGEQFGSLFPGLSSFGRDKQIAWMMWHAAADRKLPDISRVLEGVPEDLARVIGRLIDKDQSRRYRSAQEALRDLSADSSMTDRLPEEEDAEAMAAREEAAKKKRRLRLVAVLVAAFSLMLCVSLLLPEKPPGKAVPDRRGEITKVILDQEDLEIRWDDDTLYDVELTPGDEFFLNNVSVSWRDFLPGDLVVRKVVSGKSGRDIRQFYAARPETHTGRIKSIEAHEQHSTLTVEKEDGEGGDLIVDVKDDVPIVLNPGCNERPIARADLQIDDLTLVDHKPGETDQSNRVATKLAVQREVTLRGTVVGKFDRGNETFAVAVAVAQEAEPLRLPVADDCRVTINQQSLLNQRALTAVDLEEGDEVVIVHDKQVKRIDASRTLHESGEIRQVDSAARSLHVALAGSNVATPCRVAPDCTITLGDETVELADLHLGDSVEIAHASLDASNPQVTKIAATRPADPTRWAILIAVDDYYRDRSLSKPTHSVADTKLLYDVLTRRYQLPTNQAEVVENKKQTDIEEKVSEWLGKIGPKAEVIVYVAANAYRDDNGVVYLAPADFELSQIGSTGIPLQWLIDRLEACPTQAEKLLLLDCSFAAAGADLKQQPSTAEMMETVRTSLRSVAAVASCRPGQRGQVRSADGHGRFAWHLAEGYKGRADVDHDNHISPEDELFDYLDRTMAAAGRPPEPEQTPVLFLPGVPVFTPEALEAIGDLAAFLPLKSLDIEAASGQFARTETLAGKEPEPTLLFGLLMLKAKKRVEAVAQFETLKISHPNVLVSWHGVAWARFEERAYGEGIKELVELVSKIPRPKTSADPYPTQILELFEWIGRLREFATITGAPPQSPAALDAAVAARGDQLGRHYQKGREHVRSVFAGFPPGMSPARLKAEQRLLSNYASFPFDAIGERILGWRGRLREEGTPTFLVPRKSAVPGR